MAGVGILEDLRKEAVCPVCFDLFRDPVTIPECGHNLCRVCLDWCCGEATEGTCPQCRLTFPRGKFGPNRQLANIVGMVKNLNLHEAEERVCEQHQKPKHLFCKDDKTFICVMCEHRDHRGHEMLPLEDAAEEYKSQILNYRDAFRVKMEEILKRKGDTERESQDHLEQIKAEMEKTVMEFRQFYQFLVEKEKHFLAHMEDIAKKTEREKEDQLEKHVKSLQSLERIIQAIEEKLQQPETDLLQDIEKFTERCQEALSSEDSAVFQWSTLAFPDTSSFLEGVMEQFQADSPAHPHVPLKTTSTGEGGAASSVEMGTQTMSLHEFWKELQEQNDKYKQFNLVLLDLENRMSVLATQEPAPCR